MPISNFPRLRFTDVYEVEVLDRSAGFYVSAAPTDPTDAEQQAIAQTSAVSVLGVKQLDIHIELSNNPGGKLYVKVRFSGKEDPDITNVTDWGYIQVDNIDGATGISTVQEYMIEIDLATVNGVTPPGSPNRRYLVRVDQVSGLWASAIVWADGGNTLGKVYFQRQGGSM